MKLLRLGLLIMLFAGFLACKKKEYPESAVHNDALFYFKGTVNANPVSVSAGIDDYYMYSSYNQGSDGVYNFSGQLKSLGCPDSNCANTLRIQLRNSTPLPAGAAVNTQSAFATTTYPFSTAGMVYMVSFNSSYNKTPGTYTWDFGDGTSSTDPNPVHAYKKSGTYNVCLTITGSGAKGCVSSICNTIKVGLPGTPCTAAILNAGSSGNTFSFNQSSSGTGSLSYYWEFGDGSTSQAPNPSHTYGITGGYPVTLRVHDANGDEASSQYNIVTAGDGSSCAANFQVTSIAGIAAPNLSAASITWTDAHGRVHSSDRIEQPASSYFQVISVEDYSNNEKGQKTKRIRLKLKCEVSDGSNTISIDNAEAVICVAYH